MKKAHKIRMNPTAEQVEYLKRACGTRRFVYNWGREHWEAEYQAYKAEQETIPEAERKLGTVNLSEKVRFIEEGKASFPSKKRNRRKQVLCHQVKIMGATVSYEAGHCYISIQVDIKKALPPTPQPVVGVDVGLKQAAVVSDGRRLENQRALAVHLKRLGTLQRRLSRKKNNGSRSPASISRSLPCGPMCSTNSPRNWHARVARSASRICTSWG